MKKINWAALGIVVALIINAITIAYSYGSLNTQVRMNTNRLDRIESKLDDYFIPDSPFTEYKP